MEKETLNWLPASKILKDEPRLSVESKAIIKDLEKIKDSFFLLKDDKTAKTILIKITLSICAQRLMYKVYSNQILHKKKDEAKDTKQSYKKAHRSIKKIFGRSKKDLKKFRNKEWLYDLHWYRDLNYKKNNPFEEVKNEIEKFSPKSVSLVAECEFNRTGYRGGRYGQTRYDFQKLLIANAELRLMLFRYRDKDDLVFITKYFINAINSYSEKLLPLQSKFLFAFFDETNQKLLFGYYEKCY